MIYVNADGTREPIDVLGWGKKTLNESEFAQFCKDADAHYHANLGATASDEVLEAWENWMQRFRTDPNVKSE
jgi:hypothetical protein